MKNKWAEKYIKRICQFPRLCLLQETFLDFFRLQIFVLLFLLRAFPGEFGMAETVWNIKYFVEKILPLDLSSWRLPTDANAKRETNGSEVDDKEIFQYQRFSHSFISSCMLATQSAVTRVTIYEHVLISIKLFPFNNQSTSTAQHVKSSHHFERVSRAIFHCHKYSNYHKRACRMVECMDMVQSEWHDNVMRVGKCYKTLNLGRKYHKMWVLHKTLQKTLRSRSSLRCRKDWSAIDRWTSFRALNSS